MKQLHFYILSLLALTLGIVNPVHASAQGQPSFTEVPSHFAVMSETDKKDSIQVFDIKSGQIIKSISNDDKIQTLANELISSVAGLAPEISPDNKAKYIIRLPISKPRQIKIGQTNLLINEIFLFYAPGKQSSLLVFDENKKPFLLQYTADITPLIQYISNSD